MRYTHFKRADLDVSQMALGTWAIGGAGYGETEDSESIRAIRTALDNGVNFIDTARAYGTGHAEKLIGQAIKGYDREKILIATKCGVMVSTLKAIRGAQGHVRDASFANILYECEKSLRALDVDYIDVLYLHWPDFDTPLQETAEAFNTLKKQGKIRFVGVSNFTADQIEELDKYCQIDVIQQPFSMIVKNDVEIMKWAKEKGIDTFTYGALGSGILSGKYRTLPQFGEKDPRSTGFYPYFKEPYFSKVMLLVNELDKIAEEVNRPVNEVTLNWTVRNDFVSSTLCGVRTSEQAKANTSAFDWALTDEQFERINKAIEQYIDFDGSTSKQLRPRSASER